MFEYIIKIVANTRNEISLAKDSDYWGECCIEIPGSIKHIVWFIGLGRLGYMNWFLTLQE